MLREEETSMPVLANGTIVNDQYQPTGAGTVDVNTGTITPPTREPVIVSSQGMQSTVNDSTTQLQKAEQAILEARRVQTQTNEVLKGQGKPEVPLPNWTPTSPALNNPTGNPATQPIVDTINNTVQSGQLSSDQNQTLQQLQQKEAEALSHLTAARTAADTKDYGTLNARMAEYQRSMKEYQDQLVSFHNELAPLRTKLTATMTPGAQEQEINTKLADLRNEAAKFKLQTEKDKFAEFQGQTQGFAQGRASEIDIKASFKNQEYALEEKNLLTRLGLLQNAREMEGKTLEQRMSYIKDDFQLQTQITEKLNKQEEQIFGVIDKLQEDQKNTLFKFLDQFKGMSTEDMSPQTQAQLKQFATNSGIDFGLVTNALQAEKDRLTFENSIKTKGVERSQKSLDIQEERLRLAEEKASKGEKLTTDEKKAVAVSNFSKAFVPGARMGDGTTILGPDGYMDPKAFKAAIADAPNEGLTRAHFLEEFGNFINPQNAKEYGLTAAEEKKITGQ